MGPAEMALTRMFFGPSVSGEVAYGGFERGLGDAHDVVVGEDLFGAVVGEGEDGTAFGHERGGGAGDGDERVDADVVGDAEVLAGGQQEVVFECVGGEADGVDEDVDRREASANLREGRGRCRRRWRRRTDKEARVGLAEDAEQFFGLALQALGLIAEHQGRAGLGELLRDAVGDLRLLARPKTTATLP